MPRITSYPTVTPTTSDLLLLADVSGTNNPTKTATVGSVTGIISDVAAPASAASTGTTGQVAVDTGFIYVCTATNTWKRVAIATW
tara:strand:- start:136 stop:390 length:255 start_codon:yes stop_codon:yes gene_type:complete